MHAFLARIRSIADDMHESTLGLGRYHGMTHNTPCTGCHPEVHVPFSLPRALADYGFFRLLIGNEYSY